VGKKSKKNDTASQNMDMFNLDLGERKRQADMQQAQFIAEQMRLRMEAEIRSRGYLVKPVRDAAGTWTGEFEPMLDGNNKPIATFDASRQAREIALQEGEFELTKLKAEREYGLTYQNQQFQQAMDARRQQWSETYQKAQTALAEGDLTGYYNGQATLARQKYLSTTTGYDEAGNATADYKKQLADTTGYDQMGNATMANRQQLANTTGYDQYGNATMANRQNLATTSGYMEDGSSTLDRQKYLTDATGYTANGQSTLSRQQTEWNTILNAPKGPMDWAAYSNRLRGIQAAGQGPAVLQQFLGGGPIASVSGDPNSQPVAANGTDVALSMVYGQNAQTAGQQAAALYQNNPQAAALYRNNPQAAAQYRSGQAASLYRNNPMAAALYQQSGGPSLVDQTMQGGWPGQQGPWALDPGKITAPGMPSDPSNPWPELPPNRRPVPGQPPNPYPYPWEITPPGGAWPPPPPPPGAPPPGSPPPGSPSVPSGPLDQNALAQAIYAEGLGGVGHFDIDHMSQEDFVAFLQNLHGQKSGYDDPRIVRIAAAARAANYGMTDYDDWAAVGNGQPWGTKLTPDSVDNLGIFGRDPVLPPGSPDPGGDMPGGPTGGFVGDLGRYYTGTPENPSGGPDQGGDTAGPMGYAGTAQQTGGAYPYYSGGRSYDGSGFNWRLGQQQQQQRAQQRMTPDLQRQLLSQMRESMSGPVFEQTLRERPQDIQQWLASASQAIFGSTAGGSSAAMQPQGPYGGDQRLGGRDAMQQPFGWDNGTQAGRYNSGWGGGVRRMPGSAQQDPFSAWQDSTGWYDKPKREQSPWNSGFAPTDQGGSPTPRPNDPYGWTVPRPYPQRPSPPAPQTPQTPETPLAPNPPAGQGYAATSRMFGGILGGGSSPYGGGAYGSQPQGQSQGQPSYSGARTWSRQQFKKLAPTEQQMMLGWNQESNGETPEDAQWTMERGAPGFRKSRLAQMAGIS
jgi:hypothetical protein